MKIFDEEEEDSDVDDEDVEYTAPEARPTRVGAKRTYATKDDSSEVCGRQKCVRAGSRIEDNCRGCRKALLTAHVFDCMRAWHAFVVSNLLLIYHNELPRGVPLPLLLCPLIKVR